MSRRSVVLVFGLAVLLLTGAVPSFAAQQQVTTVEFWSWATGDELKQLQDRIKLFEKANPDVKINLVTVGWTEIGTKLPVAVAGGNSPDLVTISSNWGYDLAVSKLYVDLRPYLEKERKQDPAWDIDDIFPGAMGMWQTDGGDQFAFPDSLDIQGIFYNKDRYDEAGLRYPNDKTWNWSDMLDESIKMTADLNGDGQMDRWGISDAYFNWYQLVLANGGQILTKDFKNAMNTPAARQAWEYWKKFHDVKAVRVWTSGTVNGDVSFRAGHVGLQPAGYWVALQLNGMERKLNYDVTGMPLSTPGKRAAVADGSGVMIPAGAKHPDAAWRFIKFMHSKEILAEVARQPGAMPLRRSSATIAFQIPDPPKNKAIFAQILEYTVGNPKTPKWSQVRTQLFRAGSQFFTGSSSFEQAMEYFSNQLATILK
ncbi:MAG: ABC transporter substrate-binding protein [Bacteroidota bacterium]